MALKKSEDPTPPPPSLRRTELTGTPVDTLRIRFTSPSAEAVEVDGQERRIAPATLTGGSLITSMSPFAIRSFAISFLPSGNAPHSPSPTHTSASASSFPSGNAPRPNSSSFFPSGNAPHSPSPTQTSSADPIFPSGNTPHSPSLAQTSLVDPFLPSGNAPHPDSPTQIPLSLPYNADIISPNNDRTDGHFDAEGRTLPAEQFPSTLLVDGIPFTLPTHAPATPNAVECRGQRIALPPFLVAGKLYFLAAAETDTRAHFSIDGHPTPLSIQSWTGFIGQHYSQVIIPDSARYQLLAIEEPYLKTSPIAWFASHHHTPSGDAPYRYCYLFLYTLNLPPNSQTLTLPHHPSIKILAITAVPTSSPSPSDLTPLQPPHDDFSIYPRFRLHRDVSKPTQAHR
jgi:hypothetical protein